jgi:hypothetical protein
MKERKYSFVSLTAIFSILGGGPHFVGQQIQYLSPQEYTSGKNMGSELMLANAKTVAPFSNNTNLPPPSLNGGIGGLNIVQYPP